MGKETNYEVLAAQKEDSMDRLLSSLDVCILKTLLYFDLFRYPLTAEDIGRTCTEKVAKPGEVEEALGRLVTEGFIVEEEIYYYIGKGDGYVARRKMGNQLAQKRLEKARKVSRFIGKFPYVQGVMVSGSLSKNYMEADSDLDFFIVTRPGRLWIARSFLILYKKIFLLNSHHNFCVNYFVDNDHLQVEDKNIFTATEMVYLLPTCNSGLYEKLRDENEWADEYYPNFGRQNTDDCHALSDSWWGKTIEKILNGKRGDRLDQWCMKRTLGRWQTKFNHFDEDKFELALRTRKYISKHHPTDYQQKVVTGLAKKVTEFEQVHQVKLTH